MDTAEMRGSVERGEEGRKVERRWGRGEGDPEPSKGWTPKSFMMLPTNQPGLSQIDVQL